MTNTAYPHVVNLDIEGKKFTAIMQEVQYHPVTDRTLHVDFLAVDINKPIIVSVPVKFVGNCEGVRAGGKLITPCRKLKVSGVAANIPEDLVIDITTLKVGKQINAGDLKFDNIQIVSPKGTLVVAVRATRNVEAAATSEEAAE